MNPKVSIVICAKNINDPKMQKCLDSIWHQSHKNIEVIIESEGSLVEARKRGIDKANGDYICLVDSDQVLTYHTIADCLKADADGVTWTEAALHVDTFCEKVIAYDKFLFHSAKDDDPIKGDAIPRFFKAKFLKNIDWSKLPPVTFEHNMIHKQVVDMGANIVFIPSVVYHHEPRTFRELFVKFNRYGFWLTAAMKMNRTLVLEHCGPRRVYFQLKALYHPILYLGLWYHYFIKALAAGFGALEYKIKEFYDKRYNPHDR